MYLLDLSGFMFSGVLKTSMRKIEDNAIKQGVRSGSWLIVITSTPCITLKPSSFSSSKVVLMSEPYFLTKVSFQNLLNYLQTNKHQNQHKKVRFYDTELGQP